MREVLDPYVPVELVLVVEEFGQIESSKSYIAKENIHIELASIDNVALPDLNKPSEIGAASPTGMEKVTSKRVQHDIDALSFRRGKDTLHKRRVSGVKNVFPRHTQLAHKEVFLVFRAYGCIHCGPSHLRNGYRGHSESASTRMNEYGLSVMSILYWYRESNTYLSRSQMCAIIQCIQSSTVNNRERRHNLHPVCQQLHVLEY